ncbi:alpha/beta hydrolase [Actinoalloteichus sp. AHMU CJ021]|uniref:alpha/beta fold hydrolase n=1 Tax=Actinoalloteichus sp. AHMU CJ021 TaxID=2072503 RepID=UPI000CA05ECB|nr:alpha/beta hydrolase [Actinoalloteichus sp. AHMU CJ021]
MRVQPNIVRKGQGLPLVAVHGNGVDHRLLLPLDDDLAASGSWERIYLDLPGFGLTPPLDAAGGLPELADWLVETVHELVGDEPFALLGSSLGGLLARYVVTRFPDQVLGLALIAPVVDPAPSRRVRPERSLVVRDQDLLRSLPPADAEEFTSVAARQTQESWDAFRVHALPGIRAADPDAMGRLSQRYFLRASPDTAGTFQGPTLILTGRQDHVVGYEDQFALLTHYPRATYLALDGAGHNVHLEQPRMVGTALRDWGRCVQAASGGVVEV